jgi:hypothetical protein
MNYTPDPALRDFRNFLYLGFKAIGLPSPTDLQYSIAHQIQHGPEKQIIEAFRGVGKSIITGLAVPWFLYWNPSWNILVCSGGARRADEFSKFSRLVIQSMDCLEPLRPSPGQRDSAIAFDVGCVPSGQFPSVYSRPITGMITGFRADLIIADDIETPENSETVLMREKIAEKVKEFEMIAKPETGRIIYLGTPQTEETLYAELEERGYKKVVWPVRFPTKEDNEAVDGHISPDLIDKVSKNPSLVGTTTEPTRFTDIKLQEIECNVGRTTFGLQYMLNPKLKDAELYPFRYKDLVFYDFDTGDIPERVAWNNDPDQEIKNVNLVGFKGDRPYRGVVLKDALRLPFLGIHMAVDPSGRGKDETAYSITGYLHGQIFLLDVGGFLEGFSDTTLSRLASLAKRYKVNRIFCEPNYGGGMFTKMLQAAVRGHQQCSVEDAPWAKGNKEARIIDTLGPVIEPHKLIVNAALIERDYKSTSAYSAEAAHTYQFFHQLTHIRRLPGCLHHDDRLESLAINVQSWTSVMSQKTEEENLRAKDRQFKAEMDRFLKFQVGASAPRKKPQWIARV